VTRALDADELEQRHRELQTLKRNVEVEIVAVQELLRAVGRWGRAGRPRKPPTHTDAEALEAHQRYQAGERTPWIDAGHRQYQRDHRRRAYEESKAAEQ
jgi:hypothetical protein